jgi:hypothetical protein
VEVLTASDVTRADAIGNLHATGLAPETVELLIDLEKDSVARAVVVGLLRESNRSR